MNRGAWLRPRWRKVWADLWGNKVRTLLVVLSIAVGVFAVGMVYSSYLMFSRDLTQSWTMAAPANAAVYADPFDEELVQSSAVFAASRRPKGGATWIYACAAGTGSGGRCG